MSDTQAVLTANQAFYRAFEKKDIETMSLIWSKGSVSLCIHPGRGVLKNWDQICTSWEQIFEGTSYFEIETDIIATEISGDLAYVVLTENLLQVVRGQRLEAQSVATNIFERMSQEWYLVHHHGSPLVQ